MSVTGTASTLRPRTAAPVRIFVLVTAVAMAVALNLVIAAVATAAGAPAGYGPLSVPALLIFTVVPMVFGWFGWQAISRRARHPRRTLTILVIAIFALSLIPDLVLLATGFIPGTTTAAVLGLMLTHVVVMATAVVGYVTAARR